jgi:uridine phosphorylase
MAEFASQGVAGSGLGLGIAGTALAVLNGGLGNLLGGFGGMNYAGCSENHLVNRYELAQESKIAELQSQIALRDANTYNDQKLLEVYKYFDGELKEIRQHQCDKWAAQGVINAKFEAGMDVMASQIGSINATIGSITRTVIPNANVCPGWGNVCERTLLYRRIQAKDMVFD